jgi:hypothetical protein
MSNFMDQTNIFARILGIFMVFIYAGLGVIFLFFPIFWENFTGNTRKIIGIALIIYSAFRIYRLIRTIKVNNDEE